MSVLSLPPQSLTVRSDAEVLADDIAAFGQRTSDGNHPVHDYYSRRIGGQVHPTAIARGFGLPVEIE